MTRAIALPQSFELTGSKWRVYYGAVIRATKNEGTSYLEIAKRAGVTWSTVKNHALVETRDPRMRTVVSILSVCGYDMKVTSR